MVGRHIGYHHSVTTASLASCVHHSEDRGHQQSCSLLASRTENNSPEQGKDRTDFCEPWDKVYHPKRKGNKDILSARAYRHWVEPEHWLTIIFNTNPVARADSDRRLHMQHEIKSSYFGRDYVQIVCGWTSIHSQACPICNQAGALIQ